MPALTGSGIPLFFVDESPSMKRVFAVLMFAVLIVSGVQTAVAQEPQTPGPEQAELKALEGTWDAVMKMADGSEVKGVAEYKMVCEGMWLQSDFKSDFGGMKFHGRGLDSYDATTKKWHAIWVDSMSGTPMILSGTKDGKKTVMTGEGPGPAGPAKYKTISIQESADLMTFQMFMGDAELMTVTYTRRKK